MAFIVEAFFSGCISKVINDGKDYSWAKIKSVINDKNDRNLSTRTYRIIEKALIKVTDKNFRGTDVLYEAIEKIFIEFRDNGSTIESVKCGLDILSTDASEQRCENFLEKIYEGICQDDDLFKTISLILQQRGIENNQEEFQRVNEKLNKLTEIVSNRSGNEIDLQNRESVKSKIYEYAYTGGQDRFINDIQNNLNQDVLANNIGEDYPKNDLKNNSSFYNGSNKGNVDIFSNYYFNVSYENMNYSIYSNSKQCCDISFFYKGNSRNHIRIFTTKISANTTRKMKKSHVYCLGYLSGYCGGNIHKLCGTYVDKYEIFMPDSKGFFIGNEFLGISNTRVCEKAIGGFYFLFIYRFFGIVHGKLLVAELSLKNADYESYLSGKSKEIIIFKKCFESVQQRRIEMKVD